MYGMNRCWKFRNYQVWGQFSRGDAFSLFEPIRWPIGYLLAWQDLSSCEGLSYLVISWITSYNILAISGVRLGLIFYSIFLTAGHGETCIDPDRTARVLSVPAVIECHSTWPRLGTTACMASSSQLLATSSYVTYSGAQIYTKYMQFKFQAGPKIIKAIWKTFTSLRAWVLHYGLLSPMRVRG